jgi:hypothetical protein
MPKERFKKNSSLENQRNTNNPMIKIIIYGCTGAVIGYITTNLIPDINKSISPIVGGLGGGVIATSLVLSHEEQKRKQNIEANKLASKNTSLPNTENDNTVKENLANRLEKSDLKKISQLNISLISVKKETACIKAHNEYKRRTPSKKTRRRNQ